MSSPYSDPDDDYCPGPPPWRVTISTQGARIFDWPTPASCANRVLALDFARRPPLTHRLEVVTPEGVVYLSIDVSEDDAHRVMGACFGYADVSGFGAPPQ